MAVLRAEGVGKNYGGTWVLQDCGFALPEGSVTALVGLNGAGKSTLLRLIAGLDRSSAGGIEIAGREVVFGEPPAVSYLSQERPLYRALRVREILGYAAALNEGFDAKLAREWLDAFGIPLARRCQDLSGGQHTQVALAVALAKRSPLVVLDEPMADLDPLAREDVSRRLREIAATTGRSFLLSSHVIGDLEPVCDRLLVLAHGRIVLDGPVDGLADRVRAEGGTVPATATLTEIVLGTLRGAQAGAFAPRHAD
ncbi:ABC transporter ATP-binding protein [Kitasatospora sp. NPDC058162]|uniref:ABC transporter ATP-binding protein n=1 Tax=Kitasatospora sp. NPDC058162 TaxID=3346362 RepID=UPI0036D8EF01